MSCFDCRPWFVLMIDCIWWFDGTIVLDFFYVLKSSDLYSHDFHWVISRVMGGSIGLVIFCPTMLCFSFLFYVKCLFAYSRIREIHKRASEKRKAESRILSHFPCSQNKKNVGYLLYVFGFQFSFTFYLYGMMCQQRPCIVKYDTQMIGIVCMGWCGNDKLVILCKYAYDNERDSSFALTSGSVKFK